MPLPRYQPVKKKLKPMGPSLESLDDYCMSKIIAHALIQSRSRDQEPYVGDNVTTERNLSLVCKRWYFLTQTQVADHGVLRVDLETVVKREPCKHMVTRPSIRMTGAINAVKTPKRMMPSQLGHITGVRTPVNSVRMRANIRVLSQRNMSICTNNGISSMKTASKPEAREGFSIQLLQALRFKLLKYKHIQLTGTIGAEDFLKLVAMLCSNRIERLDLVRMKIEGAKLCLSEAKLFGGEICGNTTLNQLETLTYTISADASEDPTNALLWTIYQRATNLRELRVYVAETGNAPGDGDRTASEFATGDLGDCAPSASQSFIRKLGGSPVVSTHARLARLVFERIPGGSGQGLPVVSSDTRMCPYGILAKKVLSEERSVACLETNDSSLVYFLVQTSNRLCTRLDLPALTLATPIKNLDLLHHLIRLHNLGSKRLQIHIDNFAQIGDVKSILEGFAAKRPSGARCTLNLFLVDQKFSDCEDKVKNLVQISRLAEVQVHLSALQRVSIDSCHLMWSTGRALQPVIGQCPEMPSGTCLFKITLQTYPIKANTVNPVEITIPLGKCPHYQVSATREDIARHREITRSLKKECYHQFVRSVRGLS